MSQITGFEEISESMNQALGPLDDGWRALHMMQPIARALGNSSKVDELLDRIQQAQSDVSALRAEFDDLAHSSESM